jgi:uncharacterized membrane protein (DUF4010 family)
MCVMVSDAWDVVVRLGVASLGGLAVGIEREWSVKRGHHAPHFAGTRTFLLMGLLGGLGAQLCRSNLVAAGTALLIASAALIVVAYAITSRRDDVGGTTEVAALIVLAGGALAGLGQLTLASSLFALTALVLAEKTAFHAFVARIRTQELLAAARFAVLALVIFPLLPAGPFGPDPGFRPRELWALVLLFSGLSFLSFLALRLVGHGRGYALVGALGGLISSTAVTLNFSQESRRQQKLGRVLGVGVIAACTVLPVRVALLCLAINPRLGLETLPYLAAPCLVGLVATALMLRRRDPRTIDAQMPDNPLRFGAALQMSVVFQLVLYIVGWASDRFGAHGTLISAGLLGLTDVDALTYSMVKLGGGEMLSAVAAQALAVGVLANTAFKLVLAMTLGRGVFRRVTAFGLIGLGTASLAALLALG